MKMETSTKSKCVCEYFPGAKDLLIVEVETDDQYDVEMWYVPYKKEYTLCVYTNVDSVKIPINYSPFCGRKLTEE